MPVPTTGKPQFRSSRPLRQDRPSPVRPQRAHYLTLPNDLGTMGVVGHSDPSGVRRSRKYALPVRRTGICPWNRQRYGTIWTGFSSP